jgi:Bacterial extracellular solute-binding proteins, family 3
MARLNSKISKIRLGIFSILLCFIFAFNSNSAAVQTQFPKKIRMGTRSAAYAIGRISTDKKTIGGFCGNNFELSLREEISNRKIGTTVSNQIVLNENAGGDYVRYQGLLSQSQEKKIEIECGPNSFLSGELTDKKDTRKFKDKVTFSEIFYPTGIKLLLRKDKYENLANLSVSELDSQIDNLKIGAVTDTTTYLQFVGNGRANNVTPFDKKNDALRSLDDGSIDAFATDALIAQTLFEEGVNPNKHNDKRPPYKEKKFVIFPFGKGDYLHGFDKENYVIVVKKGTPYENELLSVINKALELIKNKNGEVLFNAENDYSKLELLTKSTSPQSIVNPPTKDSPSLIEVIFALLAILVVFTIAILAITKGHISFNISNQNNKDGANIGGSNLPNMTKNLNKNSQKDEDE